MNQDQITSIIRQVLFVAAGGFITKGYVDAATAQTIIGAIVVLGTSFWALYTRRNTALVVSAATVPDVSKIVGTNALAGATSSDKVVGPSGSPVS